MKFLKLFFLIFNLIVTTSVLFSNQLLAQDSLKVKKIKILPLPAFGYSPETKALIGAVALFQLNLYNDTVTRSSNAKIEFNYTQMKQVILETEWNIFFKEEKWFTQGLIHFSKYADFYFGKSATSDDTGKVYFQSDRFKMDVTALKRLQKKWFIGIGLRHFNYSNIRLNQDTLIYPELSSNSNFGMELITMNDQRNSLLTPTKGSYFRFISSNNFSQNYYMILSADYRKYFTLDKKANHTFSSKAFTQHIIGNAPFYDIALLGGDKTARGYFYGRFRDNNLSTIQMEYRAKIFWRVGLAAFGGISLVYPNFKSIESKNFKPNAGIGLRFMVDKKEKTNLRLDYAIGANGQSGFYVSFGESF